MACTVITITKSLTQCFLPRDRTAPEKHPSITTAEKVGIAFDAAALLLAITTAILIYLSVSGVGLGGLSGIGALGMKGVYIIALATTAAVLTELLLLLVQVVRRHLSLQQAMQDAAEQRAAAGDDLRPKSPLLVDDSALRQELDRKNDAIVQLEADLKATKDALNKVTRACEEEKVNANTVIVGQRDGIAKLEQAIEGLQRENHDLQEKLVKAQNSLKVDGKTTSPDMLRQLTEKNDRISHDLENALKEKEELINLASKERFSSEALTLENADLKKKLAAKEIQDTTNLGKKNPLEEELNQKGGQITNLREEIAELKEQLLKQSQGFEAAKNNLRAELEALRNAQLNSAKAPESEFEPVVAAPNLPPKPPEFKKAAAKPSPVKPVAKQPSAEPDNSSQKPKPSARNGAQPTVSHDAVAAGLGKLKKPPPAKKPENKPAETSPFGVNLKKANQNAAQEPKPNNNENLKAPDLNQAKTPPLPPPRVIDSTPTYTTVEVQPNLTIVMSSPEANPEATPNTVVEAPVRTSSSPPKPPARDPEPVTNYVTQEIQPNLTIVRPNPATINNTAPVITTPLPPKPPEREPVAKPNAITSASVSKPAPKEQANGVPKLSSEEMDLLLKDLGLPNKGQAVKETIEIVREVLENRITGKDDSGMLDSLADIEDADGDDENEKLSYEEADVNNSFLLTIEKKLPSHLIRYLRQAKYFLSYIKAIRNFIHREQDGSAAQKTLCQACLNSVNTTLVPFVNKQKEDSLKSQEARKIAEARRALASKEGKEAKEEAAYIKELESIRYYCPTMNEKFDLMKLDINKIEKQIAKTQLAKHANLSFVQLENMVKAFKTAYDDHVGQKNLTVAQKMKDLETLRKARQVVMENVLGHFSKQKDLKLNDVFQA